MADRFTFVQMSLRACALGALFFPCCAGNVNPKKHLRGTAAESRVLSNIFHGDDWSPLSCNTGAVPLINTSACLSAAVNLSSLVAAAPANGNVTVPCGKCAIVDYTDGSTVTISGGLNVLGRLHFPSAANVVINTTAVIVKGLLDMTIPDVGNKVKVTLFGTDEQYLYDHDMCNCSDAGVCAAECPHNKTVGKKPIAIAGGQINIQAIDPDCPSWTKLLEATTNGTDNQFLYFRVDPTFAACIRPGDDLVLTSDDMNPEGDVGKVESINSTTGVITLVAPVARSGISTVSGAGEDALAIEVAGLRRDVIFEAQQDDANSMHGGHLIVFHTPTVVQTISGALFENFGQDGILGRYPIHFHMCGETASIVSKNVVRNSNQRCYVVHDTNGVTIDDNVAYDTKGHCFITEKGTEERNTFSNNLGAFNKKLAVGVGQSDSPDHTPGKHEVSTFWFRNMKNNFEGNIAGGSQGTGFWIEMKELHGDQGSHTFKDNTAHSNFQGLLTYKKGWQPDNGGLIDNFKTYLNNEGMKFHITGLKITNSLIADNVIGMRYGVWNSGVELVNTVVKGYSDVAEFQKGKTCAFGNGIRPSINNHLSGGKKHAEDNIHFSGVNFTKFNCGKRTIEPYFDSRNDHVNDGMGHPIKAMNTLITDSDEASKPYFGCGDWSKTAYMEDINGTLGPQGMGSGFIVRNVQQMTTFASCSALPYGSGCSAFCEGACFRMVEIKPSLGAAVKLVLSNGMNSTAFSPNKFGNFIVVVPSGTYNGRFLDANDAELISPPPTVTAYRAPVCSAYVSESDFVFLSDAPSSVPSQAPTSTAPPSSLPTTSSAPSESPTTTCEGNYPPGKNWVSNSDIDTGTSGYSGWGSVIFHETPGYNSAGAVMMDRRSSSDTSLIARSAIRKGIPTGCLVPGMKFSITFQAKLINPTNSSTLIDCDPTKDWMQCPALRIRARNVNINGWYPGVDKGYMGFASWTAGGWNTFEKNWTVPSNWVGPYNWFLLDVIAGNNYAADQAKLIIDNLAMRLV